MRFIGATDDEETPLLLTKLMKTSVSQLYAERCPSSTEISFLCLDVTEH